MGGIIYIGGLYGAGKTTLINAALEEISCLSCLPTYLTRTPRAEEVEGRKNAGYHFVTFERYNELRAKSVHWDHTEISGNYYGTDIDVINDRIRNGAIFMVHAPNTIPKLEQMRQEYIGDFLIIWIDTDLNVCNRRLLERGKGVAEERMREAVQTNEGAALMREHSDIVFRPLNHLREDKQRFITLIKTKISWKASVHFL